MTTFQTPIIPIKQQFAVREHTEHVVDKKALCVYVALGFFLEGDSFYKDQQVLQSGTSYQLNEQQHIVKQQPYFKWHYSPRKIAFKEALSEFTNLFERIVKEQSLKQPVILPLSGGLDSRTQAVALHHLKAHVQSYSYSFKDGFKEHLIAEQIAKTCGFNFKAFEIPKGYLWDTIDDLAHINQCYTDFTHPRQMAILPALKKMSGEFSVGHWGDVLFDRGVSTQEENMPELDIVYKKVVKPGGLALANMLWRNWNLEGDFENYLKQRLQTLLDGIAIEHKGAKMRAFKSLYWAPRWTSINLSVFETVHPMHVPYYDDRMCRFICEIPEEHLADRKIQIEYIKQRNPKLANIMWESQKPYNLYNYHKNVSPRNIPYRIKNKLWRSINDVLGKKYIQRNWELQFVGMNNEEALKSRVFDAQFLEFVGGDTVQTIFKKFKTEESVLYAHPLSMLLTLSVWYKREQNDM